jgi:hypothetical protein
LRRWFWAWLFGLPLLALAIWGIVDNERLFFVTALNGLTLAALYFLVASGFTLVFGLLRNVNLAHGSLYLLGAYVGWMVGEHSGSWLLAVAAGFLFAALMGLCPADHSVPLHAGPGPAADHGHDRALDHCRRRGAVDLGRRDLPVRSAALDHRLDRAAAGRQVPDLPAGAASDCRRHRASACGGSSPAPGSA